MRKNKDLVEINLHGVLGDSLNYKKWKLDIKSIGEALNAIEILSKRKLYKFLSENDKKGIGYLLIINGKTFEPEEKLDARDVENIKKSELLLIREDLKTIDIVPVIQGADNGGFFDWMVGGTALPGSQFLPADIRMILAGVVLIIVGIILAVYSFAPLGAAVALAGIGLITAGVLNLLAVPPSPPGLPEKQKTSFLFTGPINILNEGGAIPVGYGRLIIGSTVISASYEIEDFATGKRSKQNVAVSG